jgi:hypothetical protein
MLSGHLRANQGSPDAHDQLICNSTSGRIDDYRSSKLVLAASGQLAALDPGAADAYGLISAAREHIARRREAEEAVARRLEQVERLQGQLRERETDPSTSPETGPSTSSRGLRWPRGARAREGRSGFISYRRQLSESLALLIRKDLIEHRFDAFMDFENLDSGEFDRRILSQIEAREHFIVVLEPGSLDPISQDGDWLRREIAYALAHGRNVVPVTKGFEFRRGLVLPPGVARLSSFNAVPIPPGYFDAAMERLRTRFLKMPSNPRHIPSRDRPRRRARPVLARGNGLHPGGVPRPCHNQRKTAVISGHPRAIRRSPTSARTGRPPA